MGKKRFLSFVCTKLYIVNRLVLAEMYFIILSLNFCFTVAKRDFQQLVYEQESMRYTVFFGKK